MTKLTKTQKTRGIIAASILGLTAVTGGAAIAASETITDKSELNEMRAVEGASIGLEAIVRDAEARSGGKAIEAGAEDEANGVVFQVETIGTDGTVSVQRFGLDGAFLDTVAPSNDGEERDDAAEIANAKVSLADAIATVAANGQSVLEAGYDDEDGKAVIEVETVSGDMLTEVLVDADTGQVMAQSADTDSDDADEGDDDGDMEKGESADDKS